MVINWQQLKSCKYIINIASNFEKLFKIFPTLRYFELILNSVENKQGSSSTQMSFFNFQKHSQCPHSPIFPYFSITAPARRKALSAFASLGTPSRQFVFIYCPQVHAAHEIPRCTKSCRVIPWQRESIFRNIRAASHRIFPRRSC